MMERLQKIIASRGVCSRRKAEELLLAGRVSCNGCTARLGQSADPETDEILVDGEPLPAMKKRLYLMLNKPRGYVTTLSDEKGRKNVSQLLSGCGQPVYPVGRLDMDSEGLLIFTNDGEFADFLMHPSHEVEKVYRVWVTGYSGENLRLLRRPIELDGYRIKPPGVRLIRQEEQQAVLEVVIHEGRNRQVRRMCQAANMEVKRLKRIAEGPVCLGQLKAGQWRHLTPEEVKALRN